MKRKFLIVLLIVFAILISFASSCFASFGENPVECTFGEYTFLVDGGIPADKNVLLLKGGERNYQLFVLDKDCKVTINERGSTYFTGGCYSFESCWVASEPYEFYGNHIDRSNVGVTWGVDTYLYSTVDVTNSKGEVVFPKAPQEGVILAPIVEEIPEMAEVLAEILEVLPIVIMTIVGLIGLRKALQVLFNFLHNA